jgi:hypothetical protein
MDVDDEVIGTTIPHAEFGNPECCGCLCGVPSGDSAKIVCNECMAIIKIISRNDLQRTLHEMELKLDMALPSAHTVAQFI